MSGQGCSEGPGLGRGCSVESSSQRGPRRRTERPNDPRYLPYRRQCRLSRVRCHTLVQRGRRSEHCRFGPARVVQYGDCGFPRAPTRIRTLARPGRVCGGAASTRIPRGPNLGNVRVYRRRAGRSGLAREEPARRCGKNCDLAPKFYPALSSLLAFELPCRAPPSDHVDAGARQQEPEHQAGRSPADDAAEVVVATPPLPHVPWQASLRPCRPHFPIGAPPSSNSTPLHFVTSCSSRSHSM